MQLLLFFFSSRRRHTRLQGDWSSDVCSSDLCRGEHPELRQRGGLLTEGHQLAVAEVALGAGERRHFGRLREQADEVGNDARGPHARPEYFDASGVTLAAGQGRLSSESLRRILRVGQIGRASCREKSVDLGGRRIIKKKKRRELGG